MPLVHTPTGELGQACPDFQLPGTDGKTHSRSEFAKGSPFLVMFICNHCPYVIAIEDRLRQLGQDFAKAGIPIMAISANDATKYPADSFAKMKEKTYFFPYLYDESQQVARDFGAVCTPDFFLYDGDHKLAYRGRLDDSWKEAAKVTRRELYQAALDLKAGKKLSLEQIPSMGCSLKWRELE